MAIKSGEITPNLDLVTPIMTPTQVIWTRVTNVDVALGTDNRGLGAMDES